jgi:3-oxoacyl-[acyl-carrier protein] reductase
VAAKEFGPAGIRANAVMPGWIDTPMNTSMYRDDAGGIDLDGREQVMSDMRSLSPIGMTGEPVDIAFALLYLASDASRFVTGQVLRVSGGV